MKRTNLLLALLAAVTVFGCQSKADIVSRNLSVEADNFGVRRRIVFFNGITDKYLLVIEGSCSLGNGDGPDAITVTCKEGPNQYKKHFLGLSDNVSYFVEQEDPLPSDPYRYTVMFRPEQIVPNVVKN
jgi:hypothetical protein